jgi:hypothetical protein
MLKELDSARESGRHITLFGHFRGEPRAVHRAQHSTTGRQERVYLSELAGTPMNLIQWRSEDDKTIP